jgi:hypothetical protein
VNASMELRVDRGAKVLGGLVVAPTAPLSVICW